MRPALVPLLLLAVVLSLLPRPALAQTETPETSETDEAVETDRVVILGDSHAQSLGPLLEGVARGHGLRPLGTVARPGWSTKRYLRTGRLGELLTTWGRPGLVLIALGGNDRPRTREAYAAQLRQVVEAAWESGARRVIWVGPATSSHARARATALRHDRNAAWQRAIVPGLGVEWIDSRPLTQAGHRGDGVHFTIAGYRGWARSLWQLVSVVPPSREREPVERVATQLAAVDR